MHVLLSRDIDGAAGDVYYLEMAGISSETKPTANVATGSKFYEVDTDTNYVYDEDSGDWTEAPSVVDDVNDLKNQIKSLPGVEYSVSSDTLMLSYGYTAESDAVITMNVGRPNNLFDFAGFSLKPNGKPLNECASGDFTSVWTSGTDMHSPFQFLAVANADGYYSSATDPSYTGGAHTQTINGVAVKTASSAYVNFYADGKPVSSGYGKCQNFEIRWANNVQAYNCVKADGTGRTSLVERHDMIFDGVRFNEEVKLVPSEAIKMKYWEGFAFVKWGTIFDKIRFVDATNRTLYKSTDSTIKSGNNTASGIIAWGDDHMIEMTVDTNVDLGKRSLYSGESGAFVSSTKGYFTVIQTTNPLTDMAKDSAYILRGSFRFLPNIAGVEPEPPTETLTLDKSTITVEKVGDTETLTATHTPSSQSDVFTWASSNTNVATVSDGVVTVHGIGTATITVTCGNLSASATVTQTSIKPAGEFKLLASYALSNSENVLQVSSNANQNAFGNKYTGEETCAVRYAANKDFECVPVPYGATKAKFATENGTNIRANYIYRADMNDLVTIGTAELPKYLSNDTFIYADTGANVEYGQCIAFRIDNTSMTDTPIYIYFE